MSDDEPRPLFSGYKPYQTDKEFEISIPQRFLGEAKELGITSDKLRLQVNHAIDEVCQSFDIRKEDLPLNTVRVQDKSRESHGFKGFGYSNHVIHAIGINMKELKGSTTDSFEREQLTQRVVFHEIGHQASYSFFYPQDLESLRDNWTQFPEQYLLSELAALAAQYLFDRNLPVIKEVLDQPTFTLMSQAYRELKAYDTNQPFSIYTEMFAHWLLQSYGAEKLCKLQNFRSLESAFETQYGDSLKGLMKKMANAYGISDKEFLSLEWGEDQRERLKKLYEDLPEEASIKETSDWDTDSQGNYLYVPQWYWDLEAANKHLSGRTYSLGKEVYFLAIDSDEKRVIVSKGIGGASLEDSETRTFNSVEGLFREEGYIN